MTQPPDGETTNSPEQFSIAQYLERVHDYTKDLRRGKVPGQQPLAPHPYESEPGMVASLTYDITLDGQPAEFTVSAPPETEVDEIRWKFSDDAIEAMSQQSMGSGQPITSGVKLSYVPPSARPQFEQTQAEVPDAAGWFVHVTYAGSPHSDILAGAVPDTTNADYMAALAAEAKLSSDLDWQAALHIDERLSTVLRDFSMSTGIQPFDQWLVSQGQSSGSSDS